jgi:hypothetical protein
VKTLKHAGFRKMKNKKVRYVIMNKKNNVKTLGVDFDGVIAEVNDGIPTLKCKLLKDPVTGESAREILNRFRKEGWTIIIDSCRDDVEGIKKFLNNHKIPWDYINENPLQEYTDYGRPMAPSKIFANVYLDDKAVGFVRWTTVYDDVIRKWLFSKKLMAQSRGVFDTN